MALGIIFIYQNNYTYIVVMVFSAFIYEIVHLLYTQWSATDEILERALLKIFKIMQFCIIDREL